RSFTPLGCVETPIAGTTRRSAVPLPSGPILSAFVTADAGLRPTPATLPLVPIQAGAMTPVLAGSAAIERSVIAADGAFIVAAWMPFVTGAAAREATLQAFDEQGHTRGAPVQIALDDMVLTDIA